RELSTYTARIDRIDEVAAKFPTFAMGRNEMFGELAALARSPRSDTIFADDDDTELLELRWQGVRDIRQWSDAFHGHIDTLYRERGLASRLRESALFDNVDDTTLGIIAQSALFETHGNFEWTHRYKRELSGERGSEQIIELEPLIAEQGHCLDGILLLHSGFARISETFDQGERTVGYLARDDAFGLAELIESLQGGGARKIRHSLRAIGYVDVIRIPTHVVEEHLLSVLSAAAKPATPGAPDRRVPPHADEDDLQQSLLDFLVDYRFINGTKAMAMNTDRCVNCDDCVRACATAHDGNPRFIRHGHAHQNLMIANACMHCVDPVCLIGCPTGAIHRNVATGNVVIDDGICVGCATCANACPYDNIRMVEVRDANGSFLTDPDGGQILRATKCDFCADQLGGPACQRACPHDALVRIDLRDTDTLTRWLQPQK
ncbi:MAG: 4Fe-4S dicluster domain-containing protein, partial [Hyphomicrobiales bacterium]